MNSPERKPGPVLPYVYALMGVTVIAAVALVAAIYVTLESENEARTKISAYYLTSAVLADGIARDLQSLSSFLDIDDLDGNRLGGSGSAYPREGTSVAGALYAIGRKLRQLDALQFEYGEERFAATLERLNDRFTGIERALAESAPSADDADAISALELSNEQLYRLHRIAAEDTLAGRESESASLLPNLLLLAAILAGAVVAAWLVTRMLRESLAREAATAEALAANREQMYQMQKMDALGQLVGGVAHDFNNLLTAILGQAGLLRIAAGGNAEVAAGAEEIRLAARQAASLTGQLLAFSRRLPTEAQIVMPGELLREMEPVLRRLIRKDIRLEFDYADCGPIEIDPGQFRQIVLNLVINARDAIDEHGNIMVATRSVDFAPGQERPAGIDADSCTLLIVTDSGRGMDATTVSRIFEPFFTTKERGRGTGLGLATTHGIVTGARGRILVESRPGHGSRFEIYLPNSSAQAAPADEPVSRMPCGSETVLVVEDEEQIRKLLQTGLAGLGYTVLTAANGAEGLNACMDHNRRIDVIVSDVIMPGMNGVDFMAAALKLRPDAVPIYMSGYTHDVIVDRGAADADIPLLHKPFDVDALASLIRQRLEARAVGADG